MCFWSKLTQEGTVQCYSYPAHLIQIPCRHCSLLSAVGFLLQFHHICHGQDSRRNLKGFVTQSLMKIKVMFCRKRLPFNCNSDRCLYTLNQGKRHGYDRRCLLPGFPDRTNDRGCFLTLGERSRRRVVRKSSTCNSNPSWLRGA